MGTIVDFDLEADTFLKGASTLWCGAAFIQDTKEWVIYHVDTDEHVDYPKNSRRVSIEDFLTLLSGNTPSAFNGVGYDFPLLAKLYGWEYTTEGVVDPLIMSRLSYPDRVGHSIRDWGERFKLYKGEHNDFSKFSNEMLQYCIQDTRILTRTRLALEEEMSGWDWSESLQHVQTKQELHGVLFDAAKAEQLLGVISEEIATIEEKVVKEIPMRCKDEGEVKKVFLKDGRYTQSVVTWMEGGS
jgi:hypothetical protein